MTSPLTNTGADLLSAEKCGPESELSGSDDESTGSVPFTEDSDDDVQEAVVRKKARLFTPVSTGGKKLSNSMSKSAPPRITSAKPHRAVYQSPFQRNGARRQQSMDRVPAEKF